LALVSGQLTHGASAQAPDDGLLWSVTPYVWASDTSLDLSVEDSDINGGIEIPFKDALDTIETAIQVNLETGKGKWSAFVDFTYIETSDTIERPLLDLRTDSEQTFIDAAVSYWPGGVGAGLSIFGGLRYTELKDQYDFLLEDNPLVTRNSRQSYLDGLVGARYHLALSERWGLLTRADLSMGDSEGIWVIQGLFSYTVGKRKQNAVVFGYKHKEAELQDGGINSDFTYSGPLVGFNFRF
jgi:hypothetical protein